MRLRTIINGSLAGAVCGLAFYFGARDRLQVRGEKNPNFSIQDWISFSPPLSQDQTVILQDSFDKLTDQFNNTVARQGVESEAAKAQKLAQWNGFASRWNQSLSCISKSIVDDTGVVDRLWPTFLSRNKTKGEEPSKSASKTHQD